ncbi:DUF2155 domain-containing protein [Alphaproteobacteria bacterium]|nr:DUF2155 domain-containing protein [Alphaproteobacteria bacterium]
MIPGIHKLILLVFFLSYTFSLKSQPIEGKLVEIQILDKITANVQSLIIAVNENLKFESIRIEIYACFKNPPEEVPENFVLLKIFDEINPNIISPIYQGWMISSSPATTPLEHPIYDLWVKDCKIEIDF